jgi:uncharacterized protein DUF6011
MLSTHVATSEPLETTHCNAGQLEGRRFFLAGKAIFTITSHRTGKHYTYRINKKDDDPTKPPVYFVALLTGPNNENDYSYVGMLDAETGDVRRTKGSRVGEDAESFKGVRWALSHVFAGRPLVGAMIQHAGRCGRCARTLTEPESIACGIGPECRGKMGW